SLMCCSPRGWGVLHFKLETAKQREGDPMVWVLPLRSRQPVVLVKSGVSLELGFASDNREP
ncbi:hypothetical protein, partial [Polaromonas eurypsychrophila]|uniref:hypothetical protein n=1 Tax=Polaromonas eurypsychrophila TaxID=1614635 RepID=UPI001E5CE50C